MNDTSTYTRILRALVDRGWITVAEILDVANADATLEPLRREHVTEAVIQGRRRHHIDRDVIFGANTYRITAYGVEYLPDADRRLVDGE